MRQALVAIEIYLGIPGFEGGRPNAPIGITEELIAYIYAGWEKRVLKIINHKGQFRAGLGLRGEEREWRLIDEIGGGEVENPRARVRVIGLNHLGAGGLDDLLGLGAGERVGINPWPNERPEFALLTMHGDTRSLRVKVALDSGIKTVADLRRVWGTDECADDELDMRQVGGDGEVKAEGQTPVGGG